MLTDIDPMPFGKYKGTPMQDVPCSYLHWLWTSGHMSTVKLDKEPEPQYQKNAFFVASYIVQNLEALQSENTDLIW